MELNQLVNLLRVYPEAKGKVFQVSRLSDPNLGEIEDPYGGTSGDFETCYQIIRQCCDNLLHRINTTS